MAASTSDWPIGVTAVMLPSLDFDEQLALCAELGVTHYVFRPRLIPDDQRDKAPSPWGLHRFDLTPQRLADEGAQLAERIRAAGLIPFGTVPFATADNDDPTLKLHIAGAAAAGCANVRINPPPYPDTLFDYEKYLSEAIEHYRRAVALAKPHGLKIVIEMHRFTATTGPGLARLLVQHFEPSELSVILDLPNAAFEGFVNPPLSISAVAPWIDQLHVGGGRMLEDGRDDKGFLKMQAKMTALVDSGLYVPQWIDLIKQLDRRPPLIIEDYSTEPGDADRLRNTVEQLRRLL